jgi:DNA mismatch repair protein MutS
LSTPVRQQYLRLKAECPGALLLFRLGDFYEMFDADAETAARELGLTLTGRQFEKGIRAPMAGVPCDHADVHIGRLVERGYKVAIAEQIGDPRASKGLVERRIVRIITPGTLREPNLIDSVRNNFLASVLRQDGAVGIAYADISTGEFFLQHVVADPIDAALVRELARIGPAECLWPRLTAQNPLIEPEIVQDVVAGTSWTTHGPSNDGMSAPGIGLQDAVSGCVFTLVESTDFAVESARSALAEYLGVSTLSGKPYAQFTLALGAAGALLAYLRRTQPASLPILRQPILYVGANHMTLDAPTRRNLELTQTMRGGAPGGSLLAVLDRTRTPMGGRLLRRWLNSPLVVLPPLLRRQQSVATIVGSTERRLRIIEALSGIGDIDRLVCRAQQGNATPRELLSLARALDRLDNLRAALKDLDTAGETASRDLDPTGDNLTAIRAALDPCAEIASEIRNAFVENPPPNASDGGFVRAGYSDRVDEIDFGSRETREWLADIETTERARTGIKSLKVVYSRVFGYAIEVSKSGLTLVPDDYARKQTVAGGERFVTTELKQREAQLLKAQEQRFRVEMEILEDLRRRVANGAGRMLRSADAVGQADVYVSLAVVALERNFQRPDLNEGDTIQIVAGRHPVVEVTQRDIAFVPNDTRLDDMQRLVVLTGPNMAGKSTYLRQVALIMLLAQVGSFVPAESATLGLVDRIFTRVGAQDDLAAGQSTFMVEMTETSAILRECTPRSLLILDEIGRGTSTYDGLALAQAVIEYLHDDAGHRAKTIFATHYHELTALAERRPHIENYRMEVLEEGERVVFLRRVVPGGADKAYGIHVAKLAGLPEGIIRRARGLLSDYEAVPITPRLARKRLREPPADVQLSLFSDR